MSEPRPPAAQSFEAVREAFADDFARRGRRDAALRGPITAVAVAALRLRLRLPPPVRSHGTAPLIHLLETSRPGAFGEKRRTTALEEFCFPDERLLFAMHVMAASEMPAPSAVAQRS